MVAVKREFRRLDIARRVRFHNRRQKAHHFYYRLPYYYA